MPYTPRIAIVGGGPSGLALALLLTQRGLRPTVLDLRPRLSDVDAARPSGMLDLHDESGLKCLRACGLYDRFTTLTGDCSEECRVLDPRETLLHRDAGGLEPRPEIARHALVRLLQDALPAGVVRWSTRVGAVSSTVDAATGATEVTLDVPADAPQPFDFVVGADGAWSRVRPLLTDAKPRYAGAVMLTATTRHASARHPRLAALAGSGSMMALGGGHGIMAQRGAQDSIRALVAVRTPDADFGGLAKGTAADAKGALLGAGAPFEAWDAQLRELLETACDDDAADRPGDKAEVWPLHVLPVGLEWAGRAGVTVVGDAAHLMSPWAGEGVNLALWDAVELAEALGGANMASTANSDNGQAKIDDEDSAIKAAASAAEWQAAVAGRLRRFERNMFRRAREKAEESAANMDMFLSEDGGQKMADMFTAAYAAADEAGGESAEKA